MTRLNRLPHDLGLRTYQISVTATANVDVKMASVYEPLWRVFPLLVTTTWWVRIVAETYRQHAGCRVQGRRLLELQQTDSDPLAEVDKEGPVGVQMVQNMTEIKQSTNTIIEFWKH